ncbi:MAG TPA: hypothetical protein VGO50_11750 [Pyrinomonadaceae bacterium]|nr:hypothetical protein [Pyrinomonadaceae bacterium]
MLAPAEKAVNICQKDSLVPNFHKNSYRSNLVFCIKVVSAKKQSNIIDDRRNVTQKKEKIMFVQGTSQISPVDQSKLVEKIDNLIAEGYEQVVVLSLDASADPPVYGLNASKKIEEE